MASDVKPVKRFGRSEDGFENYDVFISYRAPDMMSSLVSYLCDGLECAGLLPFLDSVSIDKGQDPWTCIEHAIMTSPIAIIIFSENYAQSEWCLRELHVILKTPGVKVLPVFYKVQPWEVRFPDKGRLASGFSKLEQRHSASLIDQWREDLKRASMLSGWEFDAQKRLENVLVSEIVEKISKLVNKTLPCDVGEHVIGVDIESQKIIQRLDQEASVLVLGLWGMGGIGKSTLARELYNHLRSRFAASTFVEDVTDKVMQGGLTRVQGQILKDLCKIQPEGMEDKQRGKLVLEERLCKKNILVVLDDVSENDGMEYLMSRKMLSRGSICIITSRNKRVIERATSFDVASEVYVHDVHQLGYENSKRVFALHAFRSGFKIDVELEGLVSCITKACGGVPLVLKVFGARLKDEDDIMIWKDVLKQIQSGSMMDEEKIFGCMRRSYDGLQAQQKEMFLDIACALLGQSKNLAFEAWRAQGWFGPLGVRSLVEKALVIVDKDGCFRMHEHLRDMGRAIVKKKEVLEGVTRHLWEPESLKLLRNDEILPVKFLQTLVITGPFNYEMDRSPIQLDLSSLKELRIMRCWLHPMITLSLPKNLLWFSCIQGPPSHREASIFCMPNNSEMRILDLEGFDSKALCESLENAKKLDTLNLSRNKRLCWLPDSFGALGSLRSLRLDESGIEGLPESFGSLSSLEELYLYGCSHLKGLPDSFGELGTLKILNLKESGIEGLPESFGRLSSLVDLNMCGCSHLKGLPDSFGALGSLRSLRLDESGIEGLPESFESLSSLEELYLYGCSHLKGLPDSFGELGTLKILNLKESGIEGLPESFGRLSSLVDLNMCGCSHLKGLPDSFGALGSLRSLRLDKSGIEGLPKSFGSLSSLEELYLYGCSHLKRLSNVSEALGTLRTLDFGDSGIDGWLKNSGLTLGPVREKKVCEPEELDLDRSLQTGIHQKDTQPNHVEGSSQQPSPLNSGLTLDPVHEKEDLSEPTELDSLEAKELQTEIHLKDTQPNQAEGSSEQPSRMNSGLTLGPVHEKEHLSESKELDPWDSWEPKELQTEIHLEDTQPNQAQESSEQAIPMNSGLTLGPVHEKDDLLESDPLWDLWEPNELQTEIHLKDTQPNPAEGMSEHGSRTNLSSHERFFESDDHDQPVQRQLSMLSSFSDFLLFLCIFLEPLSNAWTCLNDQGRLLISSLILWLQTHTFEGYALPKRYKWRVNSRDLKTNRFLGQGCSGIVYETTWSGKRNLARKDFPGVESDVFEIEAARLVELGDFPYIVKSFCWTIDKQSCSLVMEYMRYDLYSVIQKRKGEQRIQRKHDFAPPFGLIQSIHLISQIALGLSHLHGQEISHGDLKPSNVLVSSEASPILVKVADFGLIQTKRRSTTLVSHRARCLQTVKWKAPELFEAYLDSLTVDNLWARPQTSSPEASENVDVFSDDRIMRAADVYSFALICSHILGVQNWDPNLSWMELRKLVSSGLRPQLPSKCPSTLTALIASCWAADPQARPSFLDICRRMQVVESEVNVNATK